MILTMIIVIYYQSSINTLFANIAKAEGFFFNVKKISVFFLTPVMELNVPVEMKGRVC